MKEVIVFNATQSMVESICSDIVTFAFLLLCMWFSYSQGGGWWTFITVTMFLISLAAKLPSGRQLKISSKKEALEWAQSLPDDADDGASK